MKQRSTKTLVLPLMLVMLIGLLPEMSLTAWRTVHTQ
jgi:hypothetical protein